MSKYVAHQQYILLLFIFSVLSLLVCATASTFDSTYDDINNNYKNNGDVSSASTTELVSDTTSNNDEKLNPKVLRSLTSSSNDNVSIKVNNITIGPIFAIVTFTMKSKKMININRHSIKIVPSSFDFRTDNISSVKNYGGYYNTLESFDRFENSNEFGGVFEMYIDSEDLLGPNYLGKCPTPTQWSCTGLQALYDRRFMTNVSVYNPDWHKMRIIFLDIDRDENIDDFIEPLQSELKLLGMSSRFTVKYEPIGSIKLDSKEYFPGQYIDAKFNTSLVNPNNFDPDNRQLGYIKIFKVERTYKDDPSKFNRAPVAKYVEFWQGRLELITWSRPGLYQMVYFSFYNETVLAISDTFTIKQITDPVRSKTNITTDKVSYNHLDPISISINQGPKAPSITNGGKMMVAFFPYNTSIDETCFLRVDTRVGGYFYNGNRKRQHYTQNFIWNTTSTSLTYTGANFILNPGWYKVIVYVGSMCDARRLIGASTYIKVRRPDIKVSMKKRIYTQNEKVTFPVITPYSYLIRSTSNPTQLASNYILMAIPLNDDPETSIDSNGIVVDVSYPDVELVMEPGKYRLTIVYDETFVYTTYLMTISNTSFLVN